MIRSIVPLVVALKSLLIFLPEGYLRWNEEILRFTFHEDNPKVKEISVQVLCPYPPTFP